MSPQLTECPELAEAADQEHLGLDDDDVDAAQQRLDRGREGSGAAVRVSQLSAPRIEVGIDGSSGVLARDEAGVSITTRLSFTDG